MNIFKSYCPLKQGCTNGDLSLSEAIEFSLAYKSLASLFVLRSESKPYQTITNYILSCKRPYQSILYNAPINMPVQSVSIIFFPLRLFRHSFLAQYDIYNIQTGRCVRLLYKSSTVKFLSYYIRRMA